MNKVVLFQIKIQFMKKYYKIILVMFHGIRIVTLRQKKISEEFFYSFWKRTFWSFFNFQIPPAVYDLVNFNSTSNDLLKR